MESAIISDIHLGSEFCQSQTLIEFLEWIRSEKPNRLIINGDLFEDSNFHRLEKSHWHVLSLIRGMSDEMEIIHINGNHELPTDLMSILLGVSVHDEYVIRSGGKRILLLHGDRFDDFIARHPFLTWIGDVIYCRAQKLSHRLAKFLKRNSKTFLRRVEKVRIDALRYADEKQCEIVCCAHTHHAENKDNYYNSGCWTENPCTYLAVNKGNVTLEQFG